MTATSDTGGIVQWVTCPLCRASVKVDGDLTRYQAEEVLLAECPERDYAAEEAAEQLGRADG